MRRKHWRTLANVRRSRARMSTLRRAIQIAGMYKPMLMVEVWRVIRKYKTDN